jgi:hypothetical protein
MILCCPPVTPQSIDNEPVVAQESNITQITDLPRFALALDSRAQRHSKWLFSLITSSLVAYKGRSRSHTVAMQQTWFQITQSSLSGLQSQQMLNDRNFADNSFRYIHRAYAAVWSNMMGAATEKNGFRRIQSFQTDFAPTTVTQYESIRSGMQVIVADRKGPKVNGYFTLATEIFDDSGAPHTLEHLVFMGSRSYQYKGLLDKLASRAYSGTNAWTAVDHTAYTLDTAGWDGFAQILPVYLEHIIVPTLTDNACTTEVHHIDGEGNDAGVVYSEMQALQYSSTELMDLRARRLLYPENVGFRYETGGMMEALRVLTPERIRQFHKVMYQPRNLAVIIVGEVDHDNLLDILEKFEESIKDVIPPMSSAFQRCATQ